MPSNVQCYSQNIFPLVRGLGLGSRPSECPERHWSILWLDDAAFGIYTQKERLKPKTFILLDDFYYHFIIEHKTDRTHIKQSGNNETS